MSTTNANVILGVPLAFTGLAVIVVAFRLHVRSRSRLGWDDWVMLLAAIVEIGNRITTTLSGIYETRMPPTPQDTANAIMYNILGTPLATAVSVLARLSITILLIRLFGVHTWLRRILIAQFVVVSLLSIPFIVLTFIQSIPIQSRWDPSVTPTYTLGQDIWLSWAITTQSVYTVSDLTFVVLPTLIIWRLNMSLRQRAGLIFLVALSLLALIESILKTIYISVAFEGHGSVLSAYNQTAILTLALIEGDFVIIIGCAPVLRGGLGLIKSNYFTSSLRSLFHRASSTNKSNAHSQGHHDDSGPYYDIEMSTKQLGVHNPVEGVHTTATASDVENTDTYGHLSKVSINRTDGYAVTYQPAETAGHARN